MELPKIMFLWDIQVVLPRFQTIIFYLIHFITYLYDVKVTYVVSDGNYKPPKELCGLHEPSLSYSI